MALPCQFMEIVERKVDLPAGGPSAALPLSLERAPLISGTVKNVKDIHAAAGAAVIDQIFSCGEALNAWSDIVRGSAGARMLAEEPESVRNGVNHAVPDFQTRAFGPIEKDFVEIPFRVLRNPVQHYRFETPRVRLLRPRALTPSASSRNPSRPSYSLKRPESIAWRPSRTRWRIPVSCCSVR